jgi:hypothetical protein
MVDSNLDYLNKSVFYKCIAFSNNPVIDYIWHLKVIIKNRGWLGMAQSPEQEDTVNKIIFGGFNKHS